MDRRKRLRRGRMIFLGIGILVVLLNVAAWNSAAFSDWYIAHVFPVWVGTYGRLTGLFPFSVGEWMIGAGLVVLGLAVLLGIGWAGIGSVLAVRRLWCRRPREAAHAAGAGLGIYRKVSVAYYRFFVWTLLIVCLVMTLNCFILYHASTFSEQYFGEDDNVYALEELIGVYNMVAEQCNRLSGEMLRDEDGMALYPGSLGRDGELLDMEDMARELMARLGEEYPRLKGYYPRPKALAASDFMCQQHMQGYYFPFSMEANYNDVMHILNFPSTMCHELAHLRGYIYEDEANFIGYLACVESEDAF